MGDLVRPQFPERAIGIIVERQRVHSRPDGPGEDRGCSEQLGPHLRATRLNDDGDDAVRRGHRAMRRRERL